MKKTLPQLSEPRQIPDEKCVIRVQNREFLVDKQVFFSNVYFQSLIPRDMNSLPNEVVLTDVSSNVFEIILQYIETANIPRELDNALLLDVIGPSRKMLLYDLHDKCCRLLQITESNYLTVLSLNFQYPNDILKNNIAQFQARNFHRMKECMLLLPAERVEFLLSNTTIEAPVDEIIDFLLEWGKIKDNNAWHLSRIFRLVNMSSMTEKSLRYYLTKESLITTDKEIYNAFLASARKRTHQF